MKQIIYIVLLFSYSFSFSQTSNYEKGKIIDSIKVKGTFTETFQLYIPNSYTNNTAVVFIFDPMGNGTNGIKPFLKAAEQYNYVLVSSNNTKNGPYNNNIEITNRLFSYIFSEFKTDSRQIYTAGFSGGSRLAFTVAILTNAIQGVIGCGASAPVELSQNQNSSVNFSYIGIVGDEDMNYQEMFKFKEWLNNASINNELLTFEGSHRWPPDHEILRAFGWLELQAYKKNIRPINKEIISKLYNEDFLIANSLEKNQKLVLAVMEYERLNRVYNTFFKVDSLTKKNNALKSLANFTTEIHKQKEIAEKESKISEVFLKNFNEEALKGNSQNNFVWVQNILNELKNHVDRNDPDFLKMKKRLLYSFYAAAIESSAYYIANKKYYQALYCDKLLVKLNPNQGYWYFRLAKSYARQNDLKNTLNNLEKSIELKYLTYEKVLNVVEFSIFNNKKRFQLLINSLKKG
jgi:hypothetical protein